MTKEELLLKISGDASSAVAAVQELAQKTTEGFAEIGKTTKGAHEEMSLWGEVLKELGGSFVERVAEGMLVRDAIRGVIDMVKEGIAAFPELVEHTISVGNSLYDMSLKTGASVENLSALRYVASQTGVDFQSFSTSFTKMEQALGSTGAAAGQVQEKLGILKLDLRTLKDEKPDQAFLDIMQALEALPNRADQAAAGVALFGRGFREMAGLTQENIKELMAQAEDLGLVMSTDTAAAAHAAEIGFKGLEMQFEAVGMRIAAAFLPALAGLSRAIGETMKDALDRANKGLDDMGKGDGFLSTVARAMGTGSEAVAAQVTLYETLRDTIISFVRTGIEPSITAVSRVMEGWDALRVLGLSVLSGYQGITFEIERMILASLKFAAITDPLNAKKINADADMVRSDMDRLYNSMAANDAAMLKLKQSEQDWAGGAKTANAEIEQALNKLGATHVDVQHIISEFANVSRNAYGGASDGIVGADTAAASFQKTLAKLTETLAAAEAHQMPLSEQVRLYGQEASKAAAEAQGFGIKVSKVLQDVADGYDLSQVADKWEKWHENMYAAAAKFAEESVAAQEKANQKEADELARADTERMAASTAYTNKLNELKLTGADLAIAQINRERDAAIAALNKKSAVEDEQYKNAKHDIDDYYDFLDRAAQGSADTLEYRMRQQGVFTRDELQRQADAALLDYAQMLASGQYTTDELDAAWKKYYDLQAKNSNDFLVKYKQSIDQIGAAIGTLGQAFGNNLVGTVLGGIGKIIPAFADLKKQIESIGDSGKRAADGIAETISAVGSLVGAVSSGSRAQRVVGGALAGAMAGASMYSAFASTFSVESMGISMAVGALAGAIVGWVAANRAAAASAKEAADKQADLKNSIVSTYGSMQNASDIAARFGLVLETSIGSSGNDLKNLGKEAAALDQKLKDVDAAVQRYGLTWSEMDNPADVFAQATKAAKPLLDSYNDLIEAGYNQSAVLNGMSGDVNVWLTNVLAAGTKIPPSMEPIIDKLAEMGLLTDENKRKLLGLGDAADTLNGGSLDNVTAAAGRYGIKLDALGPKVNQLNIDKLAQQLSSDWKLLTSDGEDTNAVMAGMKDQVESVVKSALKFGDTIPESMKPMIDQMIQAGLLTDDLGNKLTDDSKLNFAKPIEESVNDLVTAIKQLVDTMKQGTTFPIHGQYVPPDNMPSGYWDQGGPTGSTPDHAATGGLVTATGIRPWPFTLGGLVNWTPIGLDSVPALLKPGEIVLNAAQQERVATTIAGAASAPAVHIHEGAIQIDRPILTDRQSIVELAQELGQQLKSAWGQQGTW